MIIQSPGDRFAVYPSPHEGSDSIGVDWYFPDDSRLNVSVHVWTLEPGASEGDHIHEDDSLDELYYLVSGELVMIVDGEEQVLRAGDAAYAPAGSDHAIENRSTATAQLMLIWGAPGPRPDHGQERFRG